ncbi:unnamed protein product [Eretmochelys imbricata]
MHKPLQDWICTEQTWGNCKQGWGGEKFHALSAGSGHRGELKSSQSELFNAQGFGRSPFQLQTQHVDGEGTAKSKPGKSSKENWKGQSPEGGGKAAMKTRKTRSIALQPQQGLEPQCVRPE